MLGLIKNWQSGSFWRLALIFLFFCFSGSLFSQELWVGSHQTTAFNLKAVDPIDGNSAVGVGSGGVIIRTFDSGDNWFAYPSGYAVDLNDVSFVSDLLGWAVGANVSGVGSLMLSTTDGGQTWERQNAPSGFTGKLNGVFFLNASNGWAVGDGGRIARTSNGGLSWEAITSGTNTRLNAVHFSDTNIGVAVGGANTAGYVMRTTNGGTTWTAPLQVAALELYDVRFIDAQTVVATGNNGVILQSTDGGINWSARTTPAGAFRPLRGLSSAGNMVFAAGDTVIVTSADGGSSWSRKNTGLRGNAVFPAEYLNGVAAANTSEAWTVGDAGIIFRSDNSGDSWRHQNTGSEDAAFNVDLNSVSFVNFDLGWAVGANASGIGSAILTTDDGGESWTRQGAPSGFSGKLNGVYFANPNNGWAVGDGGRIARTSNSGLSWEVITSGTNTRLNAVHFSDDNNGLIVGGANTAGYVMRTTNGGSTWTAPLQVAALELFDVRFVDAQTAIATGNNGVILQSSDGGINWSARTTPAGAFRPLRGLSVTGNTVFAAGDTVVVVSNDAGNTWQRKNTGLRGNAVFPAEYLNGVAMANANEGWAVGDGGIILRTSNGGDSWTPQASPYAAANIKSIVYQSGKAVFVGTVGTNGRNNNPVFTGIEDKGSNQPLSFELAQNYPNPFNPSTVIPFSLKRNEWVTLTIYDITGRVVATLLDGPMQAGAHQARFDGVDLSSGVYLYRLQAGGQAVARKMYLVK